MKPTVFLFLLCSLVYGADRSERLQEMAERQQQPARGFILQQDLAPKEPEIIEKIAEDTITKKENSTEHRAILENESIESPPQKYISMEKFYETVADLQQRIAILENDADKMVPLLESLQKSNISTKQFTLKLLELFVLLLVGAGGGSGLFAFFKKSAIRKRSVRPNNT